MVANDKRKLNKYRRSWIFSCYCCSYWSSVYCLVWKSKQKKKQKRNKQNSHLYLLRAAIVILLLVFWLNKITVKDVLALRRNSFTTSNARSFSFWFDTLILQIEKKIAQTNECNQRHSMMAYLYLSRLSITVTPSNDERQSAERPKTLVYSNEWKSSFYRYLLAWLECWQRIELGDKRIKSLLH